MDILNMLPRRFYNVGTSEILLANLTANVNIDDKTKNQTQLFLDYKIKTGETARDISSRLYDDQNFYWTIYMVNGILNEVDDWPLVDFEKKIRTKYTETQLNTIVGYSDIDRNLTDLQGVRFLNNLGDTIPTDNDLIIQFNLKPVTQYDMLFMEQDKKRNIRLIDPDFVEQFSEAVREALK